MVGDAGLLQKRSEIVDAEVPIRTAMGFAGAWLVLHEDLLATVGTIPVSSSVAISAYIAVGMPYIIPVFFVEHIVCDFRECTSPKD